MILITPQPLARAGRRGVAVRVKFLGHGCSLGRERYESRKSHGINIVIEMASRWWRKKRGCQIAIETLSHKRLLARSLYLLPTHAAVHSNHPPLTHRAMRSAICRRISGRSAASLTFHPMIPPCSSKPCAALKKPSDCALACLCRCSPGIAGDSRRAG